MHLYCSYCDEILTGSIAGPGGEITDHLITIRHVFQEASALRDFLYQTLPQPEARKPLEARQLELHEQQGGTLQLAITSFTQVNKKCTVGSLSSTGSVAVRLTEKEIAQCTEYVSRLEEWAETIRYPMRNTVKRPHFETLVRELQQLLSRLPKAEVRSGMVKSTLSPHNTMHVSLNRSLQLKS